ncbi:Uma2 family endonuclease [Gloeobacter violaceus]|uniref:Glr0695 protein n=1 Tax=Gloeobacter violaceus (strain ATCC 29082 / PCC 7421) TaxID=251221 RepID=Q7NMS0_GLOVI|nr:glr0695 [Gloeobacter violaceus PCC 7421]
MVCSNPAVLVLEKSMTAIVAPVAGEQRILLHKVSWQLFEALLEELGDNRSIRLTYARGTLEIMSPLMAHENSKRLLEKFIDILVEELELNVKSSGSMTCKRDDLEQGAEPDSGFYIANESRVRSKSRIELPLDPPPDLVVEVEYSRSAVDKLKLYAAMEVPEFWRYDGESLRIFRLEAGEYALVENSPTFAPVLTSEIPRFLALSPQSGETAAVRSFRDWVRQMKMRRI